jgi:hypothetical protein
MLRCQAQLELTFMMCFSDRSTSIGVLSDRSTFTLTNARATDLHHCFFLEDFLLSMGVGVCKSSSSLPPYLFNLFHSKIKGVKW